MSKGGSKGGLRGQLPPPPLAKKKERGEGERKKENVNLNSFDNLNIARRASEGI